MEKVKEVSFLLLLLLKEEGVSLFLLSNSNRDDGVKKTFFFCFVRNSPIFVLKPKLLTLLLKNMKLKSSNLS